MPYRASLDGIRAIAIVAVLIYHVSPGWLSGGSTGVDVFFVLSGFLITSIILHDIQDRCFSMQEFYLRRIQRLLPNAIACILAVLLLWTLFLPANASVQPGVHGLWTLVNLSNVYVWRYLGGYWGAAAETAPLTHFWSLGIEEQFYLLWSVALLVVFKLRAKLLPALIIGALLASFAASLITTPIDPVAAFYLPATRTWELALGALLAWREVFRLDAWPYPGRGASEVGAAPMFGKGARHSSRPSPMSTARRKRSWAAPIRISPSTLSVT